MSGPQFAHIQTWSRKPNAAGQSIEHVVAEANRDPEFSTHVENPAPPRVLLGNPATFAADHVAHVAARSTTVIMADGSQKSRAIRNDRHTMASIVMSYPVPRSAIVTDEAKAKLAAWEQRNLDWLREKYGDQLRVVLAHDDETQPHLHAWLLPDDPGADATTLHPGKVAKKEVEARAKADNVENREAVKLGNRALKAAMTVWQDEYHAAVGVPEGLTRSGPKRRRLSREQWQAEKATARAHAVSADRAVHAEKAVVTAEARWEAIKVMRASATAAARAAAAEITDRETALQKNAALLQQGIDDDWALIDRARSDIASERAALTVDREALDTEWSRLGQDTARQYADIDRERSKLTRAMRAMKSLIFEMASSVGAQISGVFVRDIESIQSALLTKEPLPETDRDGPSF